DRVLEIAAVEMPDQSDDIAADAAPAAIPYLLLDAHAKAIGAAAHRTGPDQFGSGASQREAAARNLLLDMNGGSALDVGGGNDAGLQLDAAANLVLRGRIHCCTLSRMRAHMRRGTSTSGSALFRRRKSASNSPSHRSSRANPEPSFRPFTSATA